ncbi:MAG TPA: ZIP family metal transporter [Ignavibacteriaceae bacterium]|nr:ZIP family metal transporter [Ignavibacteriaceae bacterium]
MNTEIIIRSVLTVASALIGASVLFTIKLDHKKLCALISFSAGALLGAAIFTLLPESSEGIGLFELLLSALSGYLLFFFISKYFSHVCPACAASHFDERTTKKFSEIVMTLFIALSIHSLLDGVAVSTTGSTSSHPNNSVFAAILTHKFPEGLALAALMLSSNYKPRKILLYVALVESVTIIGAILGFYIFESSISFTILSAITAHIAGGFIYLALHAVFGEMYRHHKGLVIGSFLLGALIIYSFHFIMG